MKPLCRTPNDLPLHQFLQRGLWSSWKDPWDSGQSQPDINGSSLSLVLVHHEELCWCWLKFDCISCKLETSHSNIAINIWTDCTKIHFNELITDFFYGEQKFSRTTSFWGIFFSCCLMAYKIIWIDQSNATKHHHPGPVSCSSAIGVCPQSIKMWS